MATILNLTQHAPTPEQVEAGVFDLPPEHKEVLKDLLNFNEVPEYEEVLVRAIAITALARGAGVTQVMIGGAPYLMGALEGTLKDNGIKPLYSFTQRVSVEKVQDDGTVVKTAIFKHIGFVEV